MFVRVCVNGADGQSNCPVTASDVEDIAERLKTMRSAPQGSAGQPYDFLDSGTSTADPDETIHEPVNDTMWWLK